MKIVIITPSCHGKNVGAVQHDISGTIEFFQNMGHTVSLYTIKTNHRDSSVITDLGEKYKMDVNWFSPSLSLKKRVIAMIKSSPALFDGASHVFDQLIKDEKFNSYIETLQPDLIFSFNSYSWPVFKFAKKKNIPSVFRSHNFESSFFWEALKPKEKVNPFNWLRYIAKHFGEKNAVKLSTAVATLPFAQVDTYYKWKPKDKIFILTLMFLSRSMRPPQFHENKKVIDLFYLGANYSVIFHLRGVKMLIEDIAPKVHAAAPGKFNFHICGAKLPEDMKEKCKDGIVYEGYVPDLEIFLSEMDAGVFPVETGKTMKGKVFESIARAFPIVISPNCFGGYNIRHEKEALVGDSTDAFVENILKLQDLQIRKNLAQGARNFGENNFSEEHITECLTDIFTATAK